MKQWIWALSKLQKTLGATKGKAFSNAIIPQILPGYIASSLYCFEGNVRYASILGYVGAGGIGIILNENLGWREYSNVGMIFSNFILYCSYYRKY